MDDFEGEESTGPESNLRNSDGPLHEFKSGESHVS